MCVFHPGEASCPCTSIPCSNFSFHGMEVFSLMVGYGNFADLRQGVCWNGLNLVLWLSSLPLNSSEGSHEGLRPESCWEFLWPWDRYGWFSAGEPARGLVLCTHTLLSSLRKCTPCTQKARDLLPHLPIHVKKIYLILLNLYLVWKALAQLKKQMLICIDSAELLQQSHWKSISYLRRQIEQDKSRANLFLLKPFVNTYWEAEN